MRRRAFITLSKKVTRLAATIPSARATASGRSISPASAGTGSMDILRPEKHDGRR